MWTNFPLHLRNSTKHNSAASQIVHEWCASSAFPVIVRLEFLKPLMWLSNLLKGRCGVPVFRGFDLTQGSWGRSRRQRNDLQNDGACACVPPRLGAVSWMSFLIGQLLTRILTWVLSDDEGHVVGARLDPDEAALSVKRLFSLGVERVKPEKKNIREEFYTMTLLETRFWLVGGVYVKISKEVSVIL